MKTILTTAYAVNPYKGSEDGTGWNLILQMARNQKVIAITRCNNQSDIEQYQLEHPNSLYENIQFIYFDLPIWKRFWKIKSRGALLYCFLWQKALPDFILEKKIEFDIAHNLNFHSDWMPSFLWKLKKPFVWGPIGHHTKIPSQYLAPYSWIQKMKDSLNWMIKKTFWSYSPALKKTINNANHIICINKEVPFMLNLETKHSILPAIASKDFSKSYKSEKKQLFSLLSVGRFVPLKGFDLSILAFAEFLKRIPINERALCKLEIVGKGPEKDYLISLVKKCGIEQYVVFIDWIERENLMKIFSRSTAFLFPSHEGAGMVVAEALSFSLPLICLNNSGPGELVCENSAIRINEADRVITINLLANAIQKLYMEPILLKRMQSAARKRFENHLQWDAKGNHFTKIYESICA